MNEFENMTNPPPPPQMEAPQEQRTLAMLSHLLGIISGFLGSLIIWLINKDKPGMDFVIDQSKEALNFQITVTIAIFISLLLTLAVIGLFLLPIVGIGSLVFSIMAGIKANEGVAYRYPFALRLIK